MVDDPKAYDARLMDITAALKWAGQWCKAPYIALIGHSMGARTVMIEAGARNEIGIPGQGRFDAYVAMSPDGPDAVFPENAWSGISKPMLILTGTRDQSMQTGDELCGTWIRGDNGEALPARDEGISEWVARREVWDAVASSSDHLEEQVISDDRPTLSLPASIRVGRRLRKEAFTSRRSLA